MLTNGLATIAQSLVSGGRGIFAVDEPHGSQGQRFARYGITPSAEMRRAYRELVIGAPGIERYVGGMIFAPDTLAQNRRGGDVARRASERGIAAGIGLDVETSELAFSPGESVVVEVDGLRERLEARLIACAEAGAQFAACRSGFAMHDDDATIRRSADALALTAVAAQNAGLVALVEPRVSSDGDHGIDRSAEMTQHVLRAVVAALGERGAQLDAIVIQPGMVTPGRRALREITTADVVSATLRVLGDTIPVAVAGIAFVPSGPDECIATERLCAMNRTMPRRRPWPLTFSYGPELQHAVFLTWRGRAENVGEAQRVLAHRAYCSGLAACGAYTEKIEAQLRTFSVPIAA